VVLAPLCVNVLYDYSKNGVSLAYAAKAFSAFLIAAISMEALFWIRSRVPRPIFSANQLGLYGKIEADGGKSITEIICESDEVDILCDTLKTFSDDELRIKAINRRIDEGARVRILVLNPDAEAVIKELCLARTANKGASIGEADIRAEIRASIGRFERILGDAKSKGGAGVVRKYSHYPTCAIYRFDDRYMVCPYTFGRGGSSPAFSMVRDDANAAFLDGLDRGFSELWNSKTSVPL
jgi:hypothetical protein